MVNYKKTKFWTLLISTLFLTSVFSAAANVKTGVYWSDTSGGDELITPESSDFIVIDVSKLPHGDKKNETDDANATKGEAIGPLPSLAYEEVELQEVLPSGESKDPASGIKKMPAETKVTKKYWHEVVVKAGDTLSTLAEDYGLPIKDVVTANELKNRDALKEGQVLYIPEDSTRVLETLEFVRFQKAQKIAEKKKALPIKITAYVVENGDSLWSIANAFDLDVNSLFGSNKLDDINKLKPGKTLRVPNQDGIFVKLKKGDTVSKLADKYGIYPSAIMAANSLLAEKDIKVGQEIFLPGAKSIAYIETSTEKGKGTSPSSSKVVERAVRGFGWPVVGQISSPFGWRRSPFGRGRDFHTGIDVRGPRGRTIVASSSGTVVYAGWMSGYGKTVVISHPGGYTSLYAHSSQLLVGNGQSVRRGQAIAAVGSTGRSTGNHLHFEIRSNGAPTNPLRFLR